VTEADGGFNRRVQRQKAALGGNCSPTSFLAGGAYRTTSK